MINLLPKNFPLPTEFTSNLDSDNTSENHWLIPPIVDLCARLGKSWGLFGSLANEGKTARKNGILHLVTPPDCKTVLENGSLIKDLQEQALQEGGVYLHILGALTEGLKGERPADVATLQQGDRQQGDSGQTGSQTGFQNGCIAVTNAVVQVA